MRRSWAVLLYHTWAWADCLFPKGAHPSYRTFPHSQRRHNMHLVPFKDSQETKCTPGSPNAFQIGCCVVCFSGMFGVDLVGRVAMFFSGVLEAALGEGGLGTKV